MARFVAVFVAVAVAMGLVVTSPVEAEEPPPDGGAPPSDATARAAALKLRGDQAMDALRYEEALEYYRESYALSPNPAILYNESRAFQARGQDTDALASMTRFLRDASPEIKARVPGLDALADEMRKRVATLDVHCSIAEARVLVDGKFVGVTPLLDPVAVSAGRRTVAVSLEGYLPYERSFQLQGAATTAIEVVLQRREHEGILALRVSGAPADVAVDGKAVGMSPVEVSLPEGTHSLALHRDGSTDLRTSTVIVAGQRKDLDLSLAGEKSILARWWFWTGVGAVVAGGTVLTYALLTSRGHSSGNDFSPSSAAVP